MLTNHFMIIQQKRGLDSLKQSDSDNVLTVLQRAVRARVISHKPSAAQELRLFNFSCIWMWNTFFVVCLFFFFFFLKYLVFSLYFYYYRQRFLQVNN